VGFGAEVEQQAQAFKQLQGVLILAILLVYAVMASQYESLRDPFIIMFSVPLGAIGVVAALKLTGTTFSLQAYIGVIMLAGIVVSNAILLVDYTNVLRRRDSIPLRKRLKTAGRTRLRPILMTHWRRSSVSCRCRSESRRCRASGTARARRHRRAGGFNTDYAGIRADGVHLFEEGWKGLRSGLPKHS
jgi:hypothetical protein